MRSRSVACALAALTAAPALACPYSIRDAGFIVRDPQPHRLYLCFDFERFTPRESVPRLDEWVDAARTRRLQESNVTVEVAEASPKSENPAAREATLLDFSPAAMMVSPTDAVTPVSSYQLGDFDKWVDTAVAKAVSSPKREELKQWLVDHWCVMVLMEGDVPESNERNRAVAEEAAKKAVGMTGEMGRTIDKPPPLIRIAYNDNDERVLLSALGLNGAGHEALAVVFGAGRRLGPVLSGAEISVDAITAYFRILGRNCTCTSDPSQILGPTVPLVWDEGMKEKAREALGFDPESPQVRGTLSGVWTNVTPGGGEGDITDFDEGYMEIPIDPDALEPQEGEEDDGEGPDGQASLGSRLAGPLMFAAVGMAIVAGGGGTALLVRRARLRG